MMPSSMYKNTCSGCSMCSTSLKAFTGLGLPGTRGARDPEHVEHARVPLEK